MNKQHFGIEVEFIVSPVETLKLDNLLYRYGNILLRNDENDTYLFREISIVPEKIYDYGFEVKTDKLELTWYNIETFRQFLIELYFIVTGNDTCSIHVHWSKEGLSLPDYYTILYQYLKSGMDKKFLVVDGFEMSNLDYASRRTCLANYYYKVNGLIKSGCKFQIPESNYRKTELYKVHDLETIEYRGTRHHFTEAKPSTIMKSITNFLYSISSIDIDESIRSIFTED